MNKILIYISLLLLASCGDKTEKETPQQTQGTADVVTLTPEQEKNADLLIGGFTRTALPATLRVNGKIDVPPQNMVSVSIPMGGYLKETRLLPGMHVSKGEVIAIIEDQQYIQLQQEYLTAKARTAYLGKDLSRQRQLNESKASSDKVLQQAEADYQAEKIKTASLARKLQLIGINAATLGAEGISGAIKIHSPINGFVSKVNVNTGKYVSPTEVLFELIDPEDIHLNLKVFERDVEKLKIGQKVTAFTNNDPDKKHICEILLIARDVNEDRSVDVHCHFEQYDKTLIPGTYMNAEIELGRDSAWMLPEEAVVRYGGKHYVFVTNGNRTYKMTEVQTGITNGNTIEIIHAEKVPGNLVTKGAYTLLMALKNKGDEE